jgi:glutamate dehydrogenase
VWPRSAKSVPISPEARAVLGIESPAQAMTPAELIHAILKAPVDLLYNGGIGTYVKAADESHAQVGDRANDAIRVDGRELRCKVVAEGGNLGCTQLGRIEYAQVGADGSGGRINTDAIDNSAGVDTSDHEVNIKILLNLVQADGELTEKQRNQLLAEMTDEVASLVLRDNYFQSQALALTRRRGVQLLEQQQRFIRYLEKQGKLNRAIEYLPSDEEIDDRRTKGTGLTQPELAVLLAYSKIWLSDALIGSDLPEDPWIASALERYFPTPLRARYAAVMPRHPLKREIVATHVLNSMINRVGPTFVHRLMEATGASAPQVVRAYLLTRECFGFVPLWQAIESLDSKVPDAAQGEMLLELGQLTVRATSWFLRSRRLAGPIGATIEAFRPAVEALGQREAARLAGLSNEGGGGLSHALTKGWIEAGVPNDLARRVASSTALQAALDIVEIAEGAKQPIETVAELHTALGEKLNLPRLRQLVNRLPAEGYWQGLAKGALLDDLAAMQRALAASAMREATAGDASPLDAWARRNDGALERAQRLLSELAEARNVDLAMLSVALRELRNLM